MLSLPSPPLFPALPNCTPFMPSFPQFGMTLSWRYVTRLGLHHAFHSSIIPQMSSNPALKSISLQETPQQPYATTSSQYTPYPRSSSQGFFPRQPTITSSHLFLAEARKHPKLMELIKLGTPMVRARANTVALPFPTRPQIQVQPAANMEVEPEVQPVAGPSSNSLIPPSGAGSRQGKKGKRRQTNNNGETSVSRPTARRLSAV